MSGDGRMSNDDFDPDLSADVKSDARVRALLSDLPRPSMPPEVWDRLSGAIASEAEARTSGRTGSSERQPDSSGLPEVVSIGSRRRRGSALRVLIAAGSVAAAGLVGMAILVTGAGGDEDNHLPGTASVVSVSTSGTKYYRQQLATQVSNRWHKTRSARTPSPNRATGTGPTASDQPAAESVITTPADPSPASEVLATTFAGTHDGLVTCLNRVAPGAEPVMLDIGTFHSDDRDPGTPAAVLAYETGNGEALDVYVIDHECGAGAERHPLAHVTAAPIEP